MRDLIFCMTHLRTPYDGKLLRVWQEMIEYQNTTPFDLLIVDSASPLSLTDYLMWPEEWKWHAVNDDSRPVVRGPRDILCFGNALGHPHHDGVTSGAGSDRALMAGFQCAIDSGYDRAVYLEMDLLLARSIPFDMMTKPAACLPLVHHGKFPETGLFIADCKDMKERDFVSRYNWRGPCWPEGEYRQWQIYGDDLQLLPIKGGRDKYETAPENLAKRWPGAQWLTHAKPETMKEFLRMNLFEVLAETL